MALVANAWSYTVPHNILRTLPVDGSDANDNVANIKQTKDWGKDWGEIGLYDVLMSLIYDWVINYTPFN